MNTAGRTIDSSVSAVLAATTPLWLGLFAMCWPGSERLSARGWVGLFLGLAGVLVLLAPSWSANLLLDLGPLCALGSAASWALGSLVLRHFHLHTPHLTAAAYQMILGGASLTLLGIAIGEPERLPERITPGALTVFLYLLIVGSLVGFVSFNWLLKHVSAAKVGTYAYVNPMVAVLVGWAAGEHITGWLAGGITVILLGVFLVRGGEHSPQLMQISESSDTELADRSAYP
jgi:drug/metabolite transporter (DMT)-like permease